MVDNVADTRFFNSFFAAEPNVTLLEPFVFEEASARHVGGIRVETAKGPVHFTVHVPEAYPQGELLFWPKEIVGYAHQGVAKFPLHGGFLCLTTPTINHLPTRLGQEIQQLHGWLTRYYVQEEPDEHYEYVPIRGAKCGHLLFDEEPADYDANRFATQQSGTFAYSQLRPANTGVDLPTQAPTFLGSGLGNVGARWAANAHHTRYAGMWTLLTQAPVLQRKLRVERWEDLLPLLPGDFYAQMRQLGLEHGFRRQSPPSLGNRFMLAVGYPIPGSDGQQITWDTLLIPLSLLRRDASVSAVRNRFEALGKQRLIWGEASNAAYSRFFGRGQLPEALVGRRVLIIGVGALGSCLAETLVRGGQRKLDFAESDLVAPGNICRSRYRFRDAGAPKSLALQQHLEALSPYVSVQIHDSIPSTAPGAQNWSQTTAWMNKYDLIFDCSANNEVLTTLHHAVPATRVIHVSVTEGAEEMIAVAGGDECSLQERREQLLAHVGRPAYPEFREGAGCWHPTFRAAGANIEAMVGLAVSELAEMARQKKRFRTFSLHHVVGRGIQVSTDQQYAQPGLGLQLIITGECLDEIERLTLLHYPKEFGGVLVGNYSADGGCAVVSRIIAPTKYKNSPTSFTPDPSCINKQLRELPEQLQFLGDWHSHPNGPAQPSSTDRATIAKLAAHPNVRTDSPILLIAQTKQHQVLPHFFVHHHGQLHAYKPSLS
jgi:proteasome lid subunit RPN8/RPN11